MSIIKVEETPASGMSCGQTAITYEVPTPEIINRFQTCDHIIGVHVGGRLDKPMTSKIIRVSSVEFFKTMLTEPFNYCPTCGARLETV